MVSIDFETKALIFNVQHYCIHDGPGIRTTVFLKGCPLRCLWCSNPESNAFIPQLCTYDSKCVGCGACVVACPQHAVSMQMTEKGIHTAIETSSFADRAVIDSVFSYVDLGLLDIKHMDPQKHLQYTGVSNEVILSNVEYIHKQKNVPVAIRIPCIPGYNDDAENIRQTADFVASRLGGDVPIHLLPYHNLGNAKWVSLGECPHLTLDPPSQEHMETLKAIVEKAGVTCQIGG